MFTILSSCLLNSNGCDIHIGIRAKDWFSIMCKNGSKKFVVDRFDHMKKEKESDPNKTFGFMVDLVRMVFFALIE